MSLAASRTDVGTDVIALLAEAGGAAEALVAEATLKVREKVAVNGRTDARLIDREQRAAHGLAWLATYAEAVRQLSRYVERMTPTIGSARPRSFWCESPPANSSPRWRAAS
jgi:(2S)-methylsuccinyl-CoA dehydrogenase